MNPMIASDEKCRQIVTNALFYGADDDGKVTKTMLAKLVYLIDFTWYYENLSPMSGMSYRKRPYGPVPDMYFRIVSEMEDEGIIAMEAKGTASLFSLHKDPKSNALNEDELNMIQRIGNAWHGRSTDEIVSFTHNQLPWQICRPDEVIPYELITQEEPERVYGLAIPQEHMKYLTS